MGFGTIEHVSITCGVELNLLVAMAVEREEQAPLITGPSAQFVYDGGLF